MQTRTNISLTASNGADTFTQSLNLTESPAGTKYNVDPQTISSAAWTAINLGPCASADLIFLKNLDATNYIQIAIANDGTGIFARPGAGRGCLLVAEPGVTYYAKAHTANCELAVFIVNP